ncbi:MAG: hypothetical protein OXG13_17700 [Gemmatimonadaceae bacterium]|nr:hypothetical protein [Gemmatimonadaceae bacterium]
MTAEGDRTMRDDPIVAEVRAVRDKLAAECGYDIKEIFQRVREQQASRGWNTYAILPVGWLYRKTRERPNVVKRGGPEKLAEDFDTWTVEKIRAHQGWMARQATGIWRIDLYSPGG